MKLVTKLNKLLDSSLIRHSKKSLATKLDNYDKIVSQYPFVEDEGTDITLNNTIEAPMLDIGVKGNSEQVQYSGKNLLAEFEETVNNGVTFKSTDKGILLNGTSSGTSVKTIFEEIITPGTYIINGITGAANNTFQVVVSINGVTKAYVTTNNYSFTLEEGDELKIRLYAYKNYGTFNNLLLPYQLEQGSTATAYEPYVGGTASPNPSYPQEITNVTGDVEVLVQNKNLLDLETLINVRGSALDVNIDSNSIELTQNSEQTYTYRIFKTDIDINKYKGKTICVSGNKSKTDSKIFISLYNSSGTQIGNLATSQLSIPSDTEAAFIGLTLYCSYATSYIGTVSYFNLQIEENTTATTYTPHKEQTLPLTLGDIELCKIGDYQDYFYKENSKWYLYKAIGKLILNGSEEWNVWNLSSETNQRFYLNLDVSKASLTDNVGTMLCNRFQVVRSTSADIEHYTFSATASHYSQPLIIINRSRLSTVDVAGFKTWLSSNNVVVYYQLETPTSTEITDTTLIKQLDAISEAMSYYGQTNITSEVEEGNTQPIISAKAMYDLNNLVSRVEQLELEV